MPANTATGPRANTTMRRHAHNQVKLALALQGQKADFVCDFVSEAATAKAAPILRKHGIDPATLRPISEGK